MNKHTAPGVSMSSSVSQVSLRRFLFSLLAPVYFVRSIVIAISWRHRALQVLSPRRRPGQVVGFTSRASTPPSRRSQTAPWRRRCGCRGRSPVSTGGCRRQIPYRSLSSGSQPNSQKVRRSFSSFPTKGDAEKFEHETRRLGGGGRRKP